MTRLFKCLSFFMLILAFVIFDLSEIALLDLDLFPRLIVLFVLFYFPWHFIRGAYKDKRLDHASESFILICAITFSGRFYLELHQIRQWSYPTAQTFPSFSPILANTVVPKFIKKSGETILGLSNFFMARVLRDANIAMKAKKILERESSYAWCDTPNPSFECAYKIFSQVIYSPEIDPTISILWVALNAKIIADEKKVLQASNLSKKDVATLSAQRIVKVCYLYLKRLEKITELTNSRYPASFELKTLKESKIQSIGQLRTYDGPMSTFISFFPIEFLQQEGDIELTLLKSAEKGIAIKFSQISSKKCLALIASLLKNAEKDQQAELLKQKAFFEKYAK